MQSAESRGPLDRQIRFLREADQLKGVLRQSSILDGSRKENSAEHSWHLALMAQVLGGYAPPGTDLSRVTAMLLIHDLVEIDAGDLFVYAGATAQARQEEAEHAAADRIFALLPPGQAAPGTGPPVNRRPGGSLADSPCPRRRCGAPPCDHVYGGPNDDTGDRLIKPALARRLPGQGGCPAPRARE